MSTDNSKNASDAPKKTKTPPVKIPLDFESALGGLLQVDTKKQDQGEKKPEEKK